MLLLIDLDNTLVDRTSAYKSWASSRFGAAKVPWLVQVDGDGYEPRERVAAAIAERYGVDGAEVLTELRAGLVDHLVLDPAVRAALVEATAAGHVPVVVTNGTVGQQEAKLRRTGLDRLVAGWTVSEAAGVRKPDRRIFELAAASAGLPLTPADWMIGDHADLDIGGGAAAGLRTAWTANGRTWPADRGFHPSVSAPDCAAALRAVLGS